MHRRTGEDGPHKGTGKKLRYAAVFAARPEWFDDEVVAQNGGCQIEGVGAFRFEEGLIHTVARGSDGGELLVSTGKHSFAQMADRDALDAVSLYRQCSGGMEFKWPDGGALLDQPVQLIEAFMIVGPLLEKYKSKGG